ncbi:PREDICTED: cholesteryl ester transfer protein isoform X2 [Elephantulus edwardii]|uniref:cholesteryl ester transfer protein isoform X2 n=1 Tax=Elephantulus edwardii TaxID=28737 RepID=UPI0003F0B364|nr:PREDICTED: cholesteryl ester transfer protein isoform X2 [Elephantulus edwardii]
MFAAILLALALLGSAHPRSKDPSYEAGIVCRITKPATLVLNQETTKVIQKAFQRTSYPDIQGEKAVMFLGQVKYGLHNIQISHLSIASSQVKLVEDKSIDISIQNVSTIFKGTLHYGYTGAWGLGISQSVDFEINTSIDLQINTELTCDSGRVQADTSDCYLSFHKLLLNLHGERDPGWIKQLFTNFISLTLKLVLKRQVCQEINVIANIMADFVQMRAADFLSDKDIEVDISLTGSPVIKATYLESHHKAMLESHGLSTNQDILQELFGGFPLNQAQVTVHCLKMPKLSCQSQGVVVSSSVMVTFVVSQPGGQPFVTYTFEEDIITTTQASYSKKKLFLNVLDFQIKPKVVSNLTESSESLQSFLRSMITTVGIPEVSSRMEVGLTAFMNTKNLDLFEIIDPEIITRDGYLLLQMDFGFPENLLVDFLQHLT